MWFTFFPQVWVLDATPGKVYAAGDDTDHPEELIAALREMPAVVSNRYPRKLNLQNDVNSF